MLTNQLFFRIKLNGRIGLKVNMPIFYGLVAIQSIFRYKCVYLLVNPFLCPLE